MSRPLHTAFLVEHGVTERDIERFRLRDFASAGSCKVIDLGRHRNSAKGLEDLGIEYLHLRSMRELRDVIREHKFDAYVDFSSDRIRALLARRYMRLVDSDRIVSHQAVVPFLVRPRPLLKRVGSPLRIARQIRTLVEITVCRYLGARFPLPEIVVVGCGDAASRRNVQMADLVILTHSLDANIFVEEMLYGGTASPAGGAHIVMLDEDLPEHPDYKIHHLRPPIDAHSYYDLLVPFLASIETASGLKVVIAAHPSRDPGELERLTGARFTVVYGATCASVTRASLVLLHGSTARSFAVLARVPTVFLTSRAIEDSWFGDVPRLGAELLGSPFVALERLCNPDLYANWTRPVEEARFRAYEARYLRATPTLEPVNSWSLVIDALRRRKAFGPNGRPLDDPRSPSHSHSD
jgi:hypothetical protein